MMIQEGPIFEVLEPIFRPIAQCWLDSKSEYEDRFDAAEQLGLGPSHRATFIQRKTLMNMRADSQISAILRPEISQGLDFFQYDGQEADIALLMKKLTRRKGRLRSENHLTAQQSERRQGRLAFDGRELYPVVSGYTNTQLGDSISSFEHIYIGFEGTNGFVWAHRIWSIEQGFVTPEPMEQQEFFPQARVKIRRPDVAVAEALSSKVGQNVPRKREEAMTASKKTAGKSSSQGA